jgi:DNA-directed RNA polymerase specialized sigma24 family protein
MADWDSAPLARGDEAELFFAFNRELSRHVKRAVAHTSEQTIEDACAFAWAQLLSKQPDRDGEWRGWLFRVAQREAWKTERGLLREWPRGEAPGLTDYAKRFGGMDEAEMVEDLIEVVAVLAELPPRMRTVVVLRALGHSRAEIVEMTGDTPVTVSHLLTRGRYRLERVVAARNVGIERARAPRAERLKSLEHHPPAWLISRIGSPPTVSVKAGGATAQREWRRAALALDDHRALVGEASMDAPPENAALRQSFAKAFRSVAAYDRVRGCGRGATR